MSDGSKPLDKAGESVGGMALIRFWMDQSERDVLEGVDPLNSLSYLQTHLDRLVLKLQEERCAG